MKEAVARGNAIRCLPARYTLALLGSIGMGIIYSLKVNMSVALIGMLNHTAIAEDSGRASQAPPLDEGSNSSYEDTPTVVTFQDGPFVWSDPLQGMILSGYFWGFILSQIPGGRIAELYSAKWMMFLSVIINVVCTLLTPLMATLHFYAVIAMRVGEGIGGGLALPALYVLVSRWGVPADRPRMVFMFHMGTVIGSAKAYLTGTSMLTKLGWEYVFYVMGGLSVTWCLLWIFLVKDYPQQQAFITQEERNMIVNTLGASSDDTAKKMRVPLKSVLMSPPFWAILVAHTCSNWGWYMLLIELPFYMKQVLKFDITTNIMLTGMPFLTLWIFSIILSRILETLNTKGFITATVARKLGTLVASMGPSICLLIICYASCDQAVAVALMSIAITCIGGVFCGFQSNHIDISPNFSGTLVAITNTVATLPGIIVPVFVSYITDGNQTIEAWRIIFLVTIGLFCVEVVVYSLFGSAEEQPWNRSHRENKFQYMDTNIMEQEPLHEEKPNPLSSIRVY